MTDETPASGAPVHEPEPSPSDPWRAGRGGAPLPPSGAAITPHRPDYKGAELDPARGPGLGCFWFQVAVLAFFLILIPVGINLGWPYEVLAILLFVVLGLLLFVGQTLIFLLRLVAADRRDSGRRRPLASATKTVGELEDLGRAPQAHRIATPVAEETGERPAPSVQRAVVHGETMPAADVPPAPVDDAVGPAPAPGEPGASGVAAVEPEPVEPASPAPVEPEPPAGDEAERRAAGEPPAARGGEPASVEEPPFAADLDPEPAPPADEPAPGPPLEADPDGGAGRDAPAEGEPGPDGVRQ